MPRDRTPAERSPGSPGGAARRQQPVRTVFAVVVVALAGLAIHLSEDSQGSGGRTKSRVEAQDTEAGGSSAALVGLASDQATGTETHGLAPAGESVTLPGSRARRAATARALLAGRVTTSDGAPIAHARLTVVSVRDGDVETEYEYGRRPGADTGVEGRFVIPWEEAPDHGVLRVVVESDLFLGSERIEMAPGVPNPDPAVGPFEAPVGAEDHEIVVHVGPEVGLHVALDDWATSKYIVGVRLLNARDEPLLVRNASEFDHRAPPARIHGLDTGDHAVEVFMPIGGCVLHRREFTLEDGLHDLGTIDLLGGVALCSIRLVDADGAEIPGGVVTVSTGTGATVVEDVHCSTRGSLVVPVPTRLGLLEIEHESAGRTVVSPAMFRHVAEDPIRRRVEVVLGR